MTSEQFERLLSRVKQTQKWISVEHAANSHSIERGDEFQSLIFDIQNVLRYAILYRVGIKALGKAFDCRISFAIAANACLRDSVSESTGAAFTLSGRGLKHLKHDRLLFSSDCDELTAQFDLLFKYLDKQLTELTARQCEVLLPMLQNNAALSVSDLAQQLDIATATASKSLKASGWPLLNELNVRFITQVTRLYHG
nr:hypothetical protein [Pseudoalteromonas sp. S16_S37]